MANDLMQLRIHPSIDASIERDFDELDFLAGSFDAVAEGPEWDGYDAEIEALVSGLEATWH